MVSFLYEDGIKLDIPKLDGPIGMEREWTVPAQEGKDDPDLGRVTVIRSVSTRRNRYIGIEVHGQRIERSGPGQSKS